MAVGDLPSPYGVKLKVLITATDTLIGSQRGFSRVESRQPIDYSSKDSLNRRLNGGGLYQSSVTCGAVYVPGDAARVALQTALRDGSAVKITVTEDGTDAVDCQAIVTNATLNANFPNSDSAEYSVTLECDGQWATAT